MASETLAGLWRSAEIKKRGFWVYSAEVAAYGTYPDSCADKASTALFSAGASRYFGLKSALIGATKEEKKGLKKRNAAGGKKDRKKMVSNNNPTFSLLLIARYR